MHYSSSAALHPQRNAMRLLSALAISVAALALPTRAADHFLTIGGGYSPSGNQVSLERNVLFFRDVLGDLYKGNAPAHEVFFADGNDPGRDLQYLDPAWDVPEVNRLLARLDDNEDDLGVRYRNHEIPNLTGPSRRRDIRRWFTDVGAKLKSGDRLVLYVTGHGGHSVGDNFANNHIHLWAGGRLPMREMAGMLDGLPQGVSVVVVMVQCYSGGFADLVFAGGQSTAGAPKTVRCGFFATSADRVAAGCTASVNEADYEDYSSSFWAALRGRTRTGAAVDKSSCDFDHDGIVTFAEAHAHVLLSDDSIDVPNCTSDRFLRLHSDPGASGGRLISAEEMLARLEAVASPLDKAVIDGLSKQLEIGASPPSAQYRYAAAKELGDSLMARHKAGERQSKELQGKYDRARKAIAESVELRWPELHNHWDPAVAKLLRDEPDAVVKAIKSHPRYAEFDKMGAALDGMSSRDDALEQKWAKSQRLMRALERVALAHNIEKVADPEILARYKALIAAENGTLGTPTPPTAAPR
jgi:hypothetical protein